MKILIVEDEEISSTVLENMLNTLGKCDVAVNGKEALSIFSSALKAKTPYDLVCLDIKMPEIDGLDTLKMIRATEEKFGIFALDGVKIIMTTSVGGSKEIMRAFKGGCEAYLIKPIDREELLGQIKSLGLMK